MRNRKLLEQVARLRGEGLSIAEMGRRLRRDRKTIGRYLRHLERAGNVPLRDNGRKAYRPNAAESPRKFPIEHPANSPPVPGDGVPGNDALEIPSDPIDVEVARDLLDGRSGDEIVRSGRDPAAVVRVAKNLAALERLEDRRRAPLAELISRVETLEAAVSRLAWASPTAEARVNALLRALRGPCPDCGSGLRVKLSCGRCNGDYVGAV